MKVVKMANPSQEYENNTNIVGFHSMCGRQNYNLELFAWNVINCIHLLEKSIYINYVIDLTKIWRPIKFSNIAYRRLCVRVPFL